MSTFTANPTFATKGLHSFEARFLQKIHVNHFACAPIMILSSVQPAVRKTASATEPVRNLQIGESELSAIRKACACALARRRGTSGPQAERCLRRTKVRWLCWTGVEQTDMTPTQVWSLQVGTHEWESATTLRRRPVISPAVFFYLVKPFLCKKGVLVKILCSISLSNSW